MNKLSRLLQEYMSNEELSVNDIANRIDVPPSVIHRVVYNQSIDIDTLLKVTDLISVPIEEILDIKNDKNEILKQTVWVLSIEPDFSKLFGDSARGIRRGDTEKRVLAEVAAYTMYKINQIADNVKDEKTNMFDRQDK